MILELVFPIRGESIPTDHAYHLYGALSALVPQFHDATSQMRFAAITGIADKNGLLQISERSILRIRLFDSAIRTVLPLAGKRLEIAGSAVRLGVPAVRTLIPAPMVAARMVTFKNAEEPGPFLDTARKQLTELGVTGEAQLPIHLEGERAGEPRRRIVRVKGVAIVGYSLIVAELPATDSIRLQEMGLGGRTQIGCGFFVPTRGGV